MLETDCPYMAPEPFRGKRCSSLYLPYIAEKIAEVRDTTVEEIARVTMDTENSFLGLYKVVKEYLTTSLSGKNYRILQQCFFQTF